MQLPPPRVLQSPTLLYLKVNEKQLFLQLDGPEAGKEADNDDEEDFYEAAANIPIVPNSAVPLHRYVKKTCQDKITLTEIMLKKFEPFNQDLIKTLKVL